MGQQGIDGFPPEIEAELVVIRSGWTAAQADAARRGHRRLSSAVVPPRKGREGVRDGSGRDDGSEAD